MNSSLKRLSVVSSLFLIACGGGSGPVGKPDAGTPAADSGHSEADAGQPPEDGGAGDAGTSPGDGGPPDAGTPTTPGKPTVTATEPGSPGSDPQPLVRGTAEPGVTVELFDSFGCAGGVMASGTAGEDGQFAIRFPVPANRSVIISAKARRGTLVSGCSDKWLSYAHDGRAPQVQSVTPSRDATGVALTVAPSVSFSESVTPDSVKLELACAEQPVQGTLEVSGSRATFTPAAPLPELTTCTVTVREARDAAGNALAAADSWRFTTLRIPNPLPPTFTGTTPTSPGTSTSPSILGRATSGLKVELFTTSDCSGPLVGGVTATSSGTFTLPVTVAANSTTTFWGMTSDNAGRRSACSPTSLAYVHDGVAPTVSLVSPDRGATDVATDAAVSATLNEPVKGTTTSLTVSCAGRAVSGSSTVSGAKVTFTPSLALPLDATCTATLAATVADLAGNALGTAYAWDFTMKPSPPPPAPSLTALDTPSPGKSTTPSVQGTAAASVAVDVFATADCSGTALASGTASTSGSFSIPVTVAANSTTTFRAQARSAVGRASPCSTSSLTYVHDGVAPTVTTTSPAVDAVDVDASATVTATLSEPVRNTAGALSLECGGVAVPGAVTATSTVITFSPTQKLPLDSSCTATLATTVADAVGNTLAAAYGWSFTTKASPPPAPPTFTGTSPTSPGSSKTPTVTGKSVANAFIELYASTDCAGTPVASGSADANGNFTFTVTVGENTTTLISGTARAKQTTARSACTPQVLTYRHDDIAPTVVTVSPANDATDIEPSVKLSVEFSELISAPAGAVELKCSDAVLPGTLTVTERKLSFSPSVQPALDAACTVTVKTTVKDQAGNTLAAPYGWSFLTRKAQWTPGAVVATAGGNGSVAQVEAGIDANGGAVLAWAGESPYTITRHDLNPQQGAASGVVASPGSSEQPMVARGPNGHTVVAWRDYSTSPARIFATVFIPDSGWTTPQQMSETGLFAQDPRVAVDSSGQALLVFLQRSTNTVGDDGIYARRFLPGTGWQSLVHLNAMYDASAGSLHPWVTTDGRGGFLVSWSGESSSSSSFFLYSTFLRAGANPPTSAYWERPRYSSTERGVQHPQAGCDAQGNCTVVYRMSTSGSSYTAKAIRFESNQWGAPFLLGPNSSHSDEAGVAVNAVGQVTVAFSQYSSSLQKYALLARRYEPGVGWSQPEVIGSSAAGTSGEFLFDLAMDGQGNAIVLSQRYTANVSGWKLDANRYRVGTGWLAAEELDGSVGTTSDNSYSIPRPLGPRVVMNANGQALIVYWKVRDVYARWLK